MFCGVDEAGRGPVLGPLVVGSVYVEDESVLKDIGVKDSKKLTPAVREKMYDQIIDNVPDYSLVIYSAAQIDENMKKMSLNDIELNMFVEAVSKRPVMRVYADCPDVSEERFSNAMALRLNNTTVVGRHKADDTYPVVSAASIIAKVTRDRMIEDIAKEFGCDVGSGYPSDKYTMDFIRKWINDKGVAPKHVRTSWEPVRKLLSVKANTKITDW